jgi:hypothetical protein
VSHIARRLGPFSSIAKNAARRLFFPSYSWVVDRLNWDARLRASLRKFPAAKVFETRHDLYEYVSAEHLNGKPIDYLEFGVFRGESICFWSQLNTNPKSRFWGFD